MAKIMQDTLRGWQQRYIDWLTSTALPLWWHEGADLALGGFKEKIDLSGKAVPAPRRARVQGRQSYVFAVAGQLGWDGPWAEGALHGLTFLERHYMRPSGLLCTEVNDNGSVSNPAEMLYDQAFALLSSAWASRLLPAERPRLARFAKTLMKKIEARRHPAGGFRESGDLPFLSNPHMHLFEATQAWFETDHDPYWKAIAAEIATLGMNRFVAAPSRSLHEYFDENWNLAAGDAGRSVEPGHQFEWVWLLERWARLSGDTTAHALALHLYEVGERGVDRARNVAIDEMDDSFAARRTTARLWVQTERLKAALILSEGASGAARLGYLKEADAAAAGLWRYLETPVAGLWRDRLQADGRFVEEAAPASSLYHIICAILTLSETVKSFPG